MINLRTVDLNLLVAFDALMRMRHVSRAAAMLGIGQPGMSAALARLRQQFDDPLLVRRGTEMVPTERALALAPEIARILRDVHKIMAGDAAFDPKESQRAFKLRMSDLLSALVLPRLMASLRNLAPHLVIEVVHLGPDATADALERDTIELAVSTGLAIPKSVERAKLFTDNLVCISNADLDIRAAMKNVEALAALPQIRVSQSPIDDRFADRQLAEMGLERNAPLTVPHWLSVPEILGRAPMAALVPASIAKSWERRPGLKISPLPYLDTAFDWALYWHKRHDNDPGHIWLRTQIAESCRPYMTGFGGGRRNKPVRKS